MIVKNEEEVIKRCLDCACKFADEIIVVANGKIRTAGPREEILPALLKGEYTCSCPRRSGGVCK